MRSSLRIAGMLFVLMALPTGALAADKECKAEIPVNVLMPDGQYVNDISSDQLVSESKKGNVKLGPLLMDSSARRIAFIVDNGRTVTADGKRAISTFVESILSKARPQDSFALLTVHGPLVEAGFDQGANGVRSALPSLDKKGPKASSTIADAIVRATKWFEKPGTADAIVVLADEFIDRTSGYREAGKALDDHRVRLFGLQLGVVIAGTVMEGEGFGRYGPTLQTTVMPNDASLFALGWNHAGWITNRTILQEDYTYRFNERERKWFEQIGLRMYAAIVNVDLLSIQFEPSAKAFPWKLDVIPELRRKVPDLGIAYPRRLSACDLLQQSQT